MTSRRTTALASHWLGMSEQWLGELPSHGVPPEAVTDLRENARVAVHDAICETERVMLAGLIAAKAQARAQAHNEALEAAARCVASNGHPALADELRAKFVPAPPQPDVEAVVKTAARALWQSQNPGMAWDTLPESWRIEYCLKARAVVAALTAAGALRL